MSAGTGLPELEPVRLKRCPKCETTRPTSEFSVDKKTRDGLTGHCKPCRRKYANAYRNANIEKARAQSRAWHAAHPEETRENLRKTKARAPWKERARTQVHRALRAGLLVKKPCEVCGSEKAQAHHDDYSKPLEVRWLCHPHHMEHHRKYPLIDRVSA